MALRGTIQDFALPDIFQLIGIQRKTGILTLESAKDAVTIKFLEGQVVGADKRSESVEERLGEVLVRTGRLTAAQLEDALQSQRETLQRLGHILVKSGQISEEQLVEALMVQSTQIIYRLFRWREGRYDFNQVDNLDYDKSHFIPISADTILMEGARMVDEWPIIERRIRSDNMVVRKTETGEAVEPVVESILTDDIDFNLDMLDGSATPAKPEPEPDPVDNSVHVSPEEQGVLALVDGKRTVREIADLLPLGEFDTFRILADMLTRQLIEPVKETRTSQAKKREGLGAMLLHGLALALLSGAAGAVLFHLPGQTWTPWRMLERTAATERLRVYASMTRMEKLENAVQVYYLDRGSFPPDLTYLAQAGHVDVRDLMDPWGRPYQLHVTAGGYRLVGLDGAGEPHPDLTMSRRFNTVQRMLFEGSGSTPKP